ncbi:MAG: glycosyltransferase family 4 protein [Gaiellaceae bacterium]
MSVRRVLLVSGEPVGSRMAGVGIRYYHLARELAKSFQVTLLAPSADIAEADGARIVTGRASFATVKELAARHDAVVAQHFGVRTMRHLARAPLRVIYDLYVPFVSENLAYHAAQGQSPFHRLSYRASDLLQSIALATGDAFICASERQRDLWLGRATLLERVDVEHSRRDPSLRSLVEVVPVGLDERTPRQTRRVLKGVVPGIAERDRVLLWSGGVWNWFDPLTLIRAVEQLARRRDDVKLYFLGLRHPSPLVAEMEMAQRAVALARELQLEGRFVFFNFDWVPYEERANFLLEADIGVSAHFDSLETRFAFRTRLLDHFWARLPSVVTRGDALAEVVERHTLGRTTGFEDVDSWVTAIESLLDDDDEYGRVKANIEPIRAAFAWSNVAEPLVRLLAADSPSYAGSRAAAALMRRYMRIQAQVAVQNPSLVLHHLRAR